MNKIEQYEEMIAREPNSEIYRYHLAQAYYEAGRFEDTLNQLFYILRIGTNYAPLFRLMAMSYIQLERFEDARNLLDQGIEAAKEKGDFESERELIELLDYVQEE